MPPAEAKQETEIKIRMPDAAGARKLLNSRGFRVVRRRVHERNVVFDTPDGALRRRGLLLRLRQSGKQALLTFKGRGLSRKYKMRLELESTVGDPGAIEKILSALGFTPVFLYEKFRTEFSKKASEGHICLDETPVGVFLELEGPARWIDRTARALGFSENHYIRATYGQLYRAGKKLNPESSRGKIPRANRIINPSHPT